MRKAWMALGVVVMAAAVSCVGLETDPVAVGLESRELSDEEIEALQRSAELTPIGDAEVEWMEGPDGASVRVATQSLAVDGLASEAAAGAYAQQQGVSLTCEGSCGFGMCNQVIGCDPNPNTMTCSVCSCAGPNGGCSNPCQCIKRVTISAGVEQSSWED